MEDEAHNFDRRIYDVNVAALGTRMKSLEDAMHERVIPGMDENARICSELRGAIFGHESDDGIAMKVQEMHDVFTRATNGLRVLSAVGNGIVRTIEVAGKIAKPLIYIAMLAGAIVGLIKTGSWDFKP